jgi:hypothetical protein
LTHRRFARRWSLGPTGNVDRKNDAVRYGLEEVEAMQARSRGMTRHDQA